MDSTITVNLWLFVGICAMAAVGFIRALIDVLKPDRDKSPLDPFS